MRKLVNGNIAFAYGCILAHTSFFAGYPITPSTDVYEFFEKEMPNRDGTFIYAESELTAINMIMGATVAGARAITVTSGCGFSLMQETISYVAGDFIPLVILNVMREGAGLGDIPRSQGDYNQMTKGGGNGDYHSIIISCSTIQDCLNAPTLAFTIAEKYQNPVIITYDSDIAHTMEYIDIANAIFDKASDYYKLSTFPHNNNRTSLNFILSGNTSAPTHIQNIYYHEKNYSQLLEQKYNDIENFCQMYNEYKTKDAKIILVAFGICSRICFEVIDKLRNDGIKAGLITPITLYPFPVNAFYQLKNVKSIIIVELNILKQMTKDVEYTINYKLKNKMDAKTFATISNAKISTIHSMSTLPTANEVIHFIKKEAINV